MTYKNIGIHSRHLYSVRGKYVQTLVLLEGGLIALTIIKWRVLGRHQPEATDDAVM